MVNNVEPLYDQCANPGNQLNTDGTVGGVTGYYTEQEHRRPDERRRRDLGLVPGRLHAVRRRSSSAASPARSATPRTRTSAARRSTDYVPHHDPFAYYASTANINHVSPSSVVAGRALGPDGTPATQAVNHNYDLTWFNTRARRRQPAAGLVPEGARVRQRPPGQLRPARRAAVHRRHGQRDRRSSPYWDSTAIVLTYDDSDGWYDHVQGPITHVSHDSIDVAHRRRVSAAPRRTPGAERQVRRRPARAAADRVAVGAAEPRRPHVHRAGLDHQVHRGQLEPRRGSAAARSRPRPAR